jgi:hypothetical protein
MKSCKLRLEPRFPPGFFFCIQKKFIKIDAESVPKIMELGDVIWEAH